MPRHDSVDAPPALTSRRTFLVRSGQVVGAAAVAMTAQSLLAACSSGSDSGSGESSGAGKVGGTLNFSVASIAPTIDPIVSQSGSAPLYTLVMERLFSYSQENKAVPMLAESFDVNADSTVFTIKLRKGVTYSTGAPFTSADVKFTLVTMQDPANRPTFSAQNSIQTIDTPDDYTVVLTMKTPTPFLIYSLGAFPMISRSIPYDPKTFATKIVGTGPFVLSEYTPGQSATFTKNPTYWQKDIPYVDQVKFTLTPDTTARIASLVNGSAQLVPDITPQDADLLKSRGMPPFELPLTKFYFMWLNWKKGPMSNPAMREAVAWAMNRGQIAKTAFGTYATPESTYPCKSYDGYDKTLGQHYGSTADVAKAKAALAKAGGAPTTPLVLFAPNSDPSVAKQATVISENLTAVGIPNEIQSVSYAQALASLQAGNFDLFIFPGNTVTNPTQVRSLFVTPANQTGIDDPTLTQLANQIYTGPLTETASLIKKVQQRFIEVNPLIMLVTLPGLWGKGKDVNNLQIPRGDDYFGAAKVKLS